MGMLTQWYEPETGPASLPAVYAREFVQQGHQVKVLTGFPNYPEGSLYPGYSVRPRISEGDPSLQLTRVALYPDHGRSGVRRAANYVSFGLSAATLGAGALRGADAIWVYNSPITVTLPLLTHSGFGRTPVFLHVQDIWPDSLVESGMFANGRIGQGVTRLVARAVRLTERRSAVIGVISEGARGLILERNPRVSPEKVVYVPNPTNEQLFVPTPIIRDRRGIELGLGGSFEVMYAGAIGEMQGLDTVVDAAHLLKNRQNIKFTLVGDGISRERLIRKAEGLGLANISFAGRVSQDEIPLLLARADIQLVSLAAQPFLKYTTPSKIASLLASEVAIVGQIAGDGAELLRRSGAARIAPPGSSSQLAQAIVDMMEVGAAERQRMARAGREFYEVELSAAAACSRIVDSLSS